MAPWTWTQPNAQTPLLQDGQGLPVPAAAPAPAVQDHPIFLRVCHSPWRRLSQTRLVHVRGFILAYLTALAGMLLVSQLKLKRKGEEPGRVAILFTFSFVSFVLVLIYHAVAFSWTFTHLYYPGVEDRDNGWDSFLLWALTPPVQRPHSRKRLFFSLFYTAVHVFAFMNTLIYWAVLVPQGHGHFSHSAVLHMSQDSTILASAGLFQDGWFKPFCIINLWGVTTLLAVVEIIFLNSIKRQVPVSTHILGVTLLAAGYLGYAAFGWMLTGHHAFFWMDSEIVGSRQAVAAYCSAFVALAPAMFAVMYGLIGMRENMARNHEQGIRRFMLVNEAPSAS